MAIIHASILETISLAQVVLAQDEGGAANPIVQLVPFLLIGVVFYLLIIRPQKKRQADQQKLLRTLSVGDEIVTIGGFHGGIVGLDEDTVDVEIADGVIVTMARNAISRTVTEAPVHDDDLDDFDDDFETTADDGVIDLGKGDDGLDDGR